MRLPSRPVEGGARVSKPDLARDPQGQTVSSRNAGRSLNSLSAPAAQNWPAGPEEQRPVRRGPRSPAEAPAAVRGRPARRPLPRERCPADRPGHAHATVQAPKCRAACSAATPTGTPNVTLTLTLARQDRARSPPGEPRGAAHRTPAASAPRRSRERAGRSLPAAGARCPRTHPPDGPPGVRLHHPGAVQVVVVGRRVARRQEAARAGRVDPAAALRCKRQTQAVTVGVEASPLRAPRRGPAPPSAPRRRPAGGRCPPRLEPGG